MADATGHIRVETIIDDSLRSGLKGVSDSIFLVSARINGLNLLTRSLTNTNYAVSQSLRSVSSAQSGVSKTARELSSNQAVLANYLKQVRTEATAASTALHSHQMTLSQTSAGYKQAGAEIDFINQKLRHLNSTQKVVDRTMRANALQTMSKQYNKQATELSYVGQRLTMGLTLPLVTLGRLGFSSLKKLDQELIRTRKLLDDTGDGANDLEGRMKVLGERLDDISYKWGVSRELLQGLAGDFAELGISDPKTLANLVQITNEIEKLGNVDMTDAGKLTQSIYQNLLRIRRLQGMSVTDPMALQQITQEVRGAIALFNYAENKTSLSLKNIADAFPEVSGAATSFGLNMATTAALLVPMVSAGFQVGASANSIKVSLQKLVLPTKDTRKLISALRQELGPNFKMSADIGGKGLQNLIDGYIELEKSAYKTQGTMQLFGKAFGVRQGPRMEVAIQQMAAFQKQLNNAKSSETLVLSTLERSINAQLRKNGLEEVSLKNINGIQELNNASTERSKENNLEYTKRAKIIQGIQRQEAKQLITSDKMRAAMQDISTESGKILIGGAFGQEETGRTMEEELRKSEQSLNVQAGRVRESVKSIARDFTVAFGEILKVVSPIMIKIAKAIREMSPGFKKAIGFAAIFLLTIGPIIRVFSLFKQSQSLAMLGLSKGLTLGRTQAQQLDAQLLKTSDSLLRMGKIGKVTQIGDKIFLEGKAKTNKKAMELVGLESQYDPTDTSRSSRRTGKEILGLKKQLGIIRGRKTSDIDASGLMPGTLDALGLNPFTKTAANATSNLPSQMQARVQALLAKSSAKRAGMTATAGLISVGTAPSAVAQSVTSGVQNSLNQILAVLKAIENCACNGKNVLTSKPQGLPGAGSPAAANAPPFYPTPSGLPIARTISGFGATTIPAGGPGTPQPGAAASSATTTFKIGNRTATSTPTGSGMRGTVLTPNPSGPVGFYPIESVAKNVEQPAVKKFTVRKRRDFRAETNRAVADSVNNVSDNIETQIRQLGAGVKIVPPTIAAIGLNNVATNAVQEIVKDVQEQVKEVTKPAKRRGRPRKVQTPTEPVFPTGLNPYVAPVPVFPTGLKPYVAPPEVTKPSMAERLKEQIGRGVRRRSSLVPTSVAERGASVSAAAPEGLFDPDNLNQVLPVSQRDREMMQVLGIVSASKQELLGASRFENQKPGIPVRQEKQEERFNPRNYLMNAVRQSRARFGPQQLINAKPENLKAGSVVLTEADRLVRLRKVLSQMTAFKKPSGVGGAINRVKEMSANSLRESRVIPRGIISTSPRTLTAEEVSEARAVQEVQRTGEPLSPKQIELQNKVNERIQRDAQDLAQRREMAALNKTKATTALLGTKPSLVRGLRGRFSLGGRIPVLTNAQRTMRINTQNAKAKAKAFSQLDGGFNLDEFTPEETPQPSGPRVSGLDLGYQTPKGGKPRSDSGIKKEAIAFSEVARKRMQIRRQLLTAGTKGVIGRYGINNPSVPARLRRVSARFGGFADFTRGINAEEFDRSQEAIATENLKREADARARQRTYEEVEGTPFYSKRKQEQGKKVVTPFGVVTIKKPRAPKLLETFETQKGIREKVASSNASPTAGRTKYTRLAYPLIGGSEKLLLSRKTPAVLGSAEEEAQKKATRVANRESTPLSTIARTTGEVGERSRKEMLEAARAEIPLARARERARKQALLPTAALVRKSPVSVIQSDIDSVQKEMNRVKEKVATPQIPSQIIPGTMRYSREEAAAMAKQKEEKTKKPGKREVMTPFGPIFNPSTPKVPSLFTPVVKPSAPDISEGKRPKSLSAGVQSGATTLGNINSQLTASLQIPTNVLDDFYQTLKIQGKGLAEVASNAGLQATDDLALLKQELSKIGLTIEQAISKPAESLKQLQTAKFAKGGDVQAMFQRLVMYTRDVAEKGVQGAFDLTKQRLDAAKAKSMGSTSAAPISTTGTTTPAAAKTGMIGNFNRVDLKAGGDEAYAQMQQLAAHMREFGISTSELNQLSVKQLQYLADAIKGGTERTKPVVARKLTESKTKAIAIIQNEIADKITEDAITVAQTPAKTPKIPKTPSAVPAAAKNLDAEVEQLDQTVVTHLNNLNVAVNNATAGVSNFVVRRPQGSPRVNLAERNRIAPPVPTSAPTALTPTPTVPNIKPKLSMSPFGAPPIDFNTLKNIMYPKKTFMQTPFMQTTKKVATVGAKIGKEAVSATMFGPFYGISKVVKALNVINHQIDAGSNRFTQKVAKLRKGVLFLGYTVADELGKVAGKPIADKFRSANAKMGGTTRFKTARNAIGMGAAGIAGMAAMPLLAPSALLAGAIAGPIAGTIGAGKGAISLGRKVMSSDRTQNFLQNTRTGQDVQKGLDAVASTIQKGGASIRQAGESIQNKVMPVWESTKQVGVAIGQAVTHPVVALHNAKIKIEDAFIALAKGAIKGTKGLITSTKDFTVKRAKSIKQKLVGGEESIQDPMVNPTIMTTSGGIFRAEKQTDLATGQVTKGRGFFGKAAAGTVSGVKRGVAGTKKGIGGAVSGGAGLAQNALSMVVPPQFQFLTMLFPQLIKFAQRFTKTFSLITIVVLAAVGVFKFLQSTFGEWKDSAGPFLTNFKAAWTALAGIFTTVKIALTDFFKSFFGGSQKSSGSMQDMGKKILKVSEIVRDFAIKFVRFFNLTIKPALYSFLSGLKLVIQGIVAIFNGIFNIIKGIVQKFQGQGDEAGKSFNKGFEMIKSGAFKLFKGVIKALSVFLIIFIRAIEKVAAFIINIFEKVVILVVKLISLLVRGVVNLFFMIVKGLVVIIQQMLNIWKELQTAYIKIVAELVKIVVSLFFGLPKFIVDLVKKLIDVFAFIITGWGTILDKMSELFIEWTGKILDYAKNQDGFLGAFFDVTGITAISKGLKLVTGLVGKGISAIGSVYETAGGLIKGVSDKVLGGISDGLEGFTKKATDGVDTLTNKLLRGVTTIAGVGQSIYKVVQDANNGVLRLVDQATGAIIRTIDKASDLPGMLADILVGWIEKISIGDDISRSLGDDFKGKVKEKVDDALENLDPEAAVAAGEDIANAVTEGLKTLKTNFFDKVVDNLGKSLEKQKNKITEALNLQKDNQLKIFDDQIAAIDALAAAEEKLTATIEFENQKREAEAERALQKKNYEKQRALAIYEGRIDDARNLDQEETKNRKDAEKSLKDLETGRQKTLQAENRDTAKAVITAQKSKAAEAFDKDIKAFEEFAAEVLAKGTFTQAELESQFAEISGKASEMSGTMQESFKTFYTEIPNIISANTDRTAGMFSTDMGKLVTAAKTNFGTVNDLANPETILGATGAMLAGSAALFTTMMPAVIAEYSTGVDGLAEINRNFADPANENSPGKLFEKAISDANEALKREYIKMQTSATSAFAAIVKGINEELNGLAIDAALDSAIEKLKGIKTGGGSSVDSGPLTKSAPISAGGYATRVEDLSPSLNLSSEQKTLYSDIASGLGLIGFNYAIPTAMRSPAQNLSKSTFAKQVGKDGFFAEGESGSYISNIKKALNYYGYNAGTSDKLGAEAAGSVAKFQAKYGISPADGRVRLSTAEKLGLFSEPGVEQRYYGGPIKRMMGGPIGAYGAGGSVPGFMMQGVPALLHGGEYVINAKAVQNLGSGFLQYLNNLKYGMPKFSVPNPSMPNVNINQTVNVNGGNSENINNYNFYVDNFIGEDKWFEGMMNEYNVKVIPNKQKSAGLESRVVRSYNGINKGI